MKNLPMSPDRAAIEAATLRRLSTANKAELDALADLLRVRLNAAANGIDLSVEMVELLGPKAEALPDAVLTLYLREVPVLTFGDLRAHLHRFASKDLAARWLRIMGLSRLSDREAVPRPRVFPRALLAADLATKPDGKKGSTSTPNRSLQFLAKANLTVESSASERGAKDTMVSKRLLELFEAAVAAMPLIPLKGNPREIRKDPPSTLAMVALAIFASLALPTTAEALPVPAACGTVWGGNGCDTIGTAPAAMNFGQSGIQAQASPSASFQVASLDEVLLGSRRLIGQNPIPQPVDPLQHWQPFWQVPAD